MFIFLSSSSEVLTSDHFVLLTPSTLSLLVAVFLISKIFISFSFQILISFWHFLCFFIFKHVQSQILSTNFYDG